MLRCCVLEFQEWRLMRHCMGVSGKRPCIGPNSEKIRFTGSIWSENSKRKEKSYTDLKQKEIEFQVGDKCQHGRKFLELAGKAN
ncbi:hypothetical protein EPI10_016121 [Gossypium australe]|uniref:Uncharacterized protein n=1 Tax=Gossypium australe TaxID=47621 RepID=A0A5B6VMB1_9ROSI|nr:hypothetical protein EPI10_016121 [Gossypium australe]